MFDSGRVHLTAAIRFWHYRCMEYSSRVFGALESFSKNLHFLHFLHCPKLSGKRSSFEKQCTFENPLCTVPALSALISALWAGCWRRVGRSSLRFAIMSVPGSLDCRAHRSGCEKAGAVFFPRIPERPLSPLQRGASGKQQEVVCDVPSMFICSPM